MKEKIKKPKTKGVCKVPVVMQLEALECGAACLTMILAYYDKWIPLEQVRKDCGVSRDGVTARSILIAGRSYGLEVVGYSYDTKNLLDEKNHIKFPCIIFWNFNHFVVLDGFKGKKAYINDPAKGVYSVAIDDFDDCYSGICLQLTPGENFKPSGKKGSVFPFIKKRLKKQKVAVIFAVVTSFVTAIVGVLSPIFNRIFLDELLPGKNESWIPWFFLIFAFFVLIQIIIGIFQTILSLRITGKFDAIGSTSFMWKILHLPIEFFSQRSSGDVKMRKESNASIANSIVNTIAPLALQFIMMIIYFVIMIRYNWILTLVGIAAIGINTFVATYINKKRINFARMTLRDEIKLNVASIAGIDMVETIKANGSENAFFSRWSGYQASVNKQRMKFSKLSNCIEMIPTFVSSLANNLILILGVILVFKGEFTIGMIMAFQGFLSSFMSPALQIIQSGQAIQQMQLDMERITDVMEYPTDNAFLDQKLDKNGKYFKLTGNIEIKDISFGYSPLRPPLIEHFNLTLTPGKTVAIVGGSGSGKSTIAKLISGLYQPWTGQILFDGKPTKQIDKSVFSSSVAVVDQDITLFEDTIANNIKMWDDTIQDYEMILAAKDAQLHYDIIARPDGYQYRIAENGKDFSGGQRQRIEIARVLAQDPTILILDEATSALDAKTEYELVKAIGNRGVTSIIVAHRLSTIRSCDEIILMNNGKAIARGTHQQLMQSSDEYRNLMQNE